MRADRADSLNSSDAALREVDVVVVKALHLVPVSHHHRDSRRHALDVCFVVLGVVEDVIKHLVHLVKLNGVVVGKARLLEVLLEILAVALELVAVRDNRERPVPANTEVQRL